MIQKIFSSKISLLFTTASVLLALVSILLGRRLNYLEHLLMFNLLAVTMLGLAGAGLAVAIVTLFRTRGQGASPWLAAALAVVVLVWYLFYA